MNGTDIDTPQYVTASELAEFVYCKRAWWLRANDMLGETEAMSAGTRAHDSLFSFLARLQFSQKVIRVLLTATGVLLLILIVYLLFLFP